MIATSPLATALDNQATKVREIIASVVSAHNHKRTAMPYDARCFGPAQRQLSGQIAAQTDQ